MDTDNQASEKHDILVEKMFDRAEARRRGGERVVHKLLTGNLKNWYLAGILALGGALGALIGIGVGLVQGQFDLVFVARVIYTCAFITFLPGLYIVAEETTFVRCLELSGRAARLQPHEKKELFIWAQNYPRVFELLAKWGANHPNGELTGADYNQIKKAIWHIEKDRDYRPFRISNYDSTDQIEAELTSIIRRRALTDKARKTMRQVDPETQNSRQAPPKM